MANFLSSFALYSILTTPFCILNTNEIIASSMNTLCFSFGLGSFKWGLCGNFRLWGKTLNLLPFGFSMVGRNTDPLWTGTHQEQV